MPDLFEKFKPCPFCGEIPILTKHSRKEIDLWNLLHRCKIVGAISMDWSDAESHSKRWNTRFKESPMETEEESEEMEPLTHNIFDQVDREVDAMCEKAGMVSLGELLARLEDAPQDVPVEFNDGTSPGDFMSYRGFYRFIALDRGPYSVSAKKFSQKVKEVIGKTFTGYKGGNFRMSKTTPIWVSEYSKASGDGIVNVQVTPEKVILDVKNVDV